MISGVEQTVRTDAKLWESSVKSLASKSGQWSGAAGARSCGGQADMSGGRQAAGIERTGEPVIKLWASTMSWWTALSAMVAMRAVGVVGAVKVAEAVRAVRAVGAGNMRGN